MTKIIKKTNKTRKSLLGWASLKKPGVLPTLSIRVVDPYPDPDWIRIQRLCGSGSGSGSRGKKTKKFQWK
jgi:hypothetical protein